MLAFFVLLFAFQMKHFLADFPLQGKYMLGKFDAGWDWVLPLAAHAGVHLCFTFVIAVVYLRSDLDFCAMLSVIDFTIHSTVDRIKASPNMGGRWKPDNKFFWWALGADQFCHHCTHYGLIYLLLHHKGVV